MPRVDNSLVQGFLDWLVGRHSSIGNRKPVSLDTAKYYTNIVAKKKWPPEKRAHRKAWRKYIDFLYRLGIVGLEKYGMYMKFLEIGGAKPKTGRPKIHDSTIVSYMEKMIGYDSDLYGLTVLLMGGTRLAGIYHVIEISKGKQSFWYQEIQHSHGRYEPRTTCFKDFCRLYLGINYGRKHYEYIYWPKGDTIPWSQLIEFLEKQGITSYRQLKYMLNRLGIEIGIFRDYVTQRLEELAHKYDIRLDATNFILSRELSVTGAHYLNTRDWADKLFSIYVNEVVKKVIGLG